MPTPVIVTVLFCLALGVALRPRLANAMLEASARRWTLRLDPVTATVFYSAAKSALRARAWTAGATLMLCGWGIYRANSFPDASYGDDADHGESIIERWLEQMEQTERIACRALLREVAREGQMRDLSDQLEDILGK